MSRCIYSFTAATALLFTPLFSQAEGFGINSTRLIYPQGEASITATLRNTDASTPYLVQAAVSPVSTRTESAPFNVIPPLLRLDANSTHQVRILMRDNTLPNDRESVFYFRATAIPHSQLAAKDEETARVKGNAVFGVGNTIKLFYRPKGLSGDVIDAQRGMQFSRVAQGLKVSNPSPYFISFASVKVNGKSLPLEAENAKMIAPFANYVWQTSGVQGEVKWNVIDDHGGISEFSQKLP